MEAAPAEDLHSMSMHAQIKSLQKEISGKEKRIFSTQAELELSRQRESDLEGKMWR